MDQFIATSGRGWGELGQLAHPPGGSRSEYVQFSLTAELKATGAVMMKNMQEMQRA
jgi:hypothetical protein